MSRSLVVACVALLLGLAGFGGISEATAQQRELTTSDRMAILYAPQLDFTERGDPLVRVGLLEGRDSVEFTPSHDIRVMPRGDEGAEVVLPGDKTYTVSIKNGKAGDYEHWVIVEELPVKQRDRVTDIQVQWTKRGYEPRTFQVGGLLGIKGEVFDSRSMLVGVGGTDDYDEARKLRLKLEGRFGINGRIHSELTDYPSGLLELSSDEVDITLRHRDVLWVSSKPGREADIRYTVPEVPKSHGSGTETRTYGGRLIFTPDRDGQVALINKLGAERLLKGVVPSEIYTSAPEHALRAQAVAARNTIFGAIGVRNLADPYMLRSDVYDQVYKGIGAHHARTSAAVEATRGRVMFYGNRIIEAVYSANAGGFTESNENVWNAEPRPYLRGRPDGPKEKIPKAFRDGIDTGELRAFLDSDFPAYPKKSPLGSDSLYRWSKTVDASEAADWLKENGREVRKISEAEILKRGVSGRIIRMKLTAPDGDTTVIERELNVRRLFDNLRSGLFVMRVERGGDDVIDTFHFEGAGYGHGVGMCQTGAMGMAKAGRSFEEILKHYYAGIELRKLY